MGKKEEHVRIQEISRSPSLFLPAEKEVTDRPTDGRTDGRTHPLIESWLTTKNIPCAVCDVEGLRESASIKT